MLSQTTNQYNTIIESKSSPAFYYDIADLHSRSDATRSDENIEELPEGIDFQFEIKECSFDDLVFRLTQFEHEYGVTSIEIFSQYTRGELNLDEDFEEWIDLFLLWLGTAQVRQFSCR